VYIHIPKCGGIAVTRSYIAQYFIKDKKNHLVHRSWKGGVTAEYIREGKKERTKGVHYNNIHATYDQIAIQYPDYKYFTVIRNPIDRWESLYRHGCDNNFIVDWDIVTWTKSAISSLQNGAYWGTAQNLDYFEKAHFRLGNLEVLYLPAWTYYREPEVEDEEDKLQQVTAMEQLLSKTAVQAEEDKVSGVQKGVLPKEIETKLKEIKVPESLLAPDNTEEV